MGVYYENENKAYQRIVMYELLQKRCELLQSYCIYRFIARRIKTK